MRHTCTYFIFALATQLFAAGICKAQTISIKPAPAGINIDGDAKEWGDYLSYSNNKARVNYTITNDKENLQPIMLSNKEESHPLPSKISVRSSYFTKPNTCGFPIRRKQHNF